MQSATALTQEIDDPKIAASELASKIAQQLTPTNPSIGIVYGDADVDVAKLGSLLHEELGFDIVGLTTTALLERNEGYCDMGCALAVLSGGDVEFSVGCARSLKPESYPQQIEAAYEEARAALSQDPKLIIIFAPYIAAITSENYVEVLDKASGQTPIFGGVATDHYDLCYQKTFFNGEAFDDGLVFVLVAGNLKPVFAMKHDFGGKVDRKSIITKSSGSLVERVGDQSFMEWLAEMMPIPPEEEVIFHFQSTPFVMELPDYDPSEQPVVRALCSIDHKTGAGGFLSKMPEGSRLFINMIARDNLAASCKGALEQLKDGIAANPDYRYSLMIVSTCNARHLLLGDSKDLEMSIVLDALSESGSTINTIGFYSFGEICPTLCGSDLVPKNRFHNVSFALCAL
ncbi:MAG: FIST C-terminal domain-containing protein [Eggerthellaceae bacterium]|nr:FIST C-terminal domain-containing protein [Eggerthellaceae bacterium]